MKRAAKLTGRAKPNHGTAILRFVREVLRQRDLLLLATQFDDLALIYLDQDERGERKRYPGTPRYWTTRDRRERDEECLLQDWHNRPGMTLQEFSERARGTRLTADAVMTWAGGLPWHGEKRPYKAPRCDVRKPQPRTLRLWQRFRKRAGIPSYLPELQAATKEAAAGSAFQVVAPALQALASAHDACLRCFGNSFADSGDIEETDAADRDWREILNAYDAAMQDLLPYLPAGCIEHDGSYHDKNDPVYMAGDLVLQPQDPAAVDATAPKLQAGPVGEPQDAAAGEHHEYLVTLQQAAAMVSRSKKTLERRKTDSKFPTPRVAGGGGKPDEYAWSEMRLYLEREFDRKMPEHFPTAPFVRS